MKKDSAEKRSLSFGSRTEGRGRRRSELRETKEAKREEGHPKDRGEILRREETAGRCGGSRRHEAGVMKREVMGAVSVINMALKGHSARGQRLSLTGNGCRYEMLRACRSNASSSEAVLFENLEGLHIIFYVVITLWSSPNSWKGTCTLSRNRAYFLLCFTFSGQFCVPLTKNKVGQFKKIKVFMKPQLITQPQKQLNKTPPQTLKIICIFYVFHNLCIPHGALLRN